MSSSTRAGTPVPYLFDQDFTPAGATRRPERLVEAAAHRTAVEAAERAGYERGLAAGRQAAEAKAADRVAEEARRLASAAQSILAVLDGVAERVERQATELAAAIGLKLGGALVARFPAEAVEAAVADCLGPLRKAPHVVVRLAESERGPLATRIARMAEESGFAGRLVVLAEPGMQRGDCRIEWAEGGIVLDHAATARAVEDAVARHLAATATATEGEG